MNAERTILVIDDDRGVRTLLGKAVARLGYRVLVAEDGATGLSLIDEATQKQSGVPALVILRMRIQGLSSGTVLSRLRGEHPDILVVMTSGVANAATAIRSFAHPPDALLAKPFTLTELADVIESVLGQSVST